MADEDLDVLAAEYVLGTLTAQERAEVEEMAAKDAGFADRIAGWERRLGMLEAMVDPVEPPAEVWARIRERVAEVSPEAALRLPDVMPTGASANEADTGNLAALSRRVRRWRWIAALLATVAVALLLVAGIGRYRPELLPPQLRLPVETEVVERIVERTVEKRVEVPAPRPARFVAVLQSNTGVLGFLLSVDIDQRTLTVRRVAAPPAPDKSQELWLISDRFPMPHSLGLIGAEDFTRRPGLAAYDPETINNATYAVSLEPEGGSPTGGPTGTVLFAGTLIEAVPPSSSR